MPASAPAGRASSLMRAMVGSSGPIAVDAVPDEASVRGAGELDA